MSREVRRVPLDFDFPVGQTWGGYLQPDTYDFPACPDCTYEELPTIMDRLFPTPRSGSGYSPEAYAISQTFYPYMIGGPMAKHLAWHDKLGQSEVDKLLEENRLRDYVQRYDPKTRTWGPRGVPVTAAMVNAGQHNGGAGPKGAHDAIDRSILVRFRCDQLGIAVYCPTCDGHGDIATAEQRKEAEDWEGTDPPTGAGYQLWQTVSEGGPVSPVFATPEELADWIRAEGDELDGRTTSRDALIRWITDDGQSAGSFVVSDGVITSGVEFAAEVGS